LDVRPSVGADVAAVEHTKLVLYSSHNPEDADWNKGLIEKWLKEQRGIVFEQQYNLACKRFGLSTDKAPTLKIRNMKTRWGSYSAHTNTIYLTARLIEAPAEAIYYVCIHELCHLKHRNHGKEFYEAMDRYQEADWRKVKKELERKYG
jgi:predicted metal-dependent hydrolase